MYLKGLCGNLFQSFSHAAYSDYLESLCPLVETIEPLAKTTLVGEPFSRLVKSIRYATKMAQSPSFDCALKKANARNVGGGPDPLLRVYFAVGQIKLQRLPLRCLLTIAQF
jgi:hypothetical protein